MAQIKNKAIYFLVLFQMMAGCQGVNESMHPEDIEENSAVLLKRIPSEITGINFSNLLNENQKLNYFIYQYLYQGGGVAAGDINNDGLIDLFFAATRGDNRLYLNKGGLQFEDISSKSDFKSPDPYVCFGVTMVDINNDGWLDIYICRSAYDKRVKERPNLLYINNGDLSFTEQAARYGLDEKGNSIQASFFDFDRDGDLDVYIINSLDSFHNEYVMKNPHVINEYNRDKLYRNDGGHFVEISKEAGIHHLGHGLALITADFDNDGWTDIYVSNDFDAPDAFYHNNGDGTFTNIIHQAMQHISLFSMGADVADLNHDGLLDLFVVEMLSPDNYRQKVNMASMNPALFWNRVRAGLHYQYMRNMLQINLGENRFVEIAQLAGIEATDWSWTPLFADLDNDGLPELFITNGIRRDIIDKDFSRMVKQSKDSLKRLGFDYVANYIMKSTPIANYLFSYQGGYRFKDVTGTWGIKDDAAFSTGAVYADLDNDGDLELIVNNIDGEAFVYKNLTREKYPDKRHYLKVAFKGPPANPYGIGTKVTLYIRDTAYTSINLPYRGYFSSVAPVLHFGMGKHNAVDSLKVEWPDGQVQWLKKVSAGQLLTVAYEDARQPASVKKTQPEKWFTRTKLKGLDFVHRENPFDDYLYQVLLPHQLSHQGPCLCVADVDGNGTDDIYVGGAAGQSGRLYFQDKTGEFHTRNGQPWNDQAFYEDQGCLFFDADGDGDSDLYVSSGGYEFGDQPELMQDRLYLNDGNGYFAEHTERLPVITGSGSCVAASDFDLDGDLDLFIGGRLNPYRYPEPGRSYLLLNDKGNFLDVTESIAPGLSHAGMVHTASWLDYDSDGDDDLFIAGEWMPLTLYKNQSGKFENATASAGLDSSTGWWFSLLPVDVDNDGDKDIIAGNLGLNSKNKASKKYPFHIYAHDFDHNGTFDVVLGVFNQGVLYPVRGLQCSSEQVPMIKKRFHSYREFGMATLEDIYGQSTLDSALHYMVYDFHSAVFINEGGRFQRIPLPIEAQFGPIHAIASDDFNADGCPDILVAGNLHTAEVETGRYDALPGWLMIGNCDGTFDVIYPGESGIFLNSDCRSMAPVRALQTGKPTYIIGCNDDTVKIITVKFFPG